jgi:hypothetical protein
MYAETTTVSVEKSQAEIQKTLRRYGADAFGVMEKKGTAYIMFEYKKFMIQMSVPLPEKNEFIKTEAGRHRKSTQADQAYEQAIKQRWRALVLSVKGKLEAVDRNISTLEKEFMAFIIMPDGKSLGDHLLPQLVQVAESGKMPKILEIS